MSIAEIQKFLQDPSQVDSEQKSLEYLDAHYSSLEDLDALDAVCTDFEKRRNTLVDELSHSQTDLNDFLSTTRTQLKDYIHKAQELSLLRHSLADELAFLSEELLSSLSNNESGPSLLEDIETQHRNLKELESIKSYVQIIEAALCLSEASLKQIRSLETSNAVTPSSVSEYARLHEFAAKVESHCSSIEDAQGQQTLNLVVFVRIIRDKTWTDIKQALFSKLLSVIEPLGWPGSVDFGTASASTRKDFEQAFTNLLRLQDIKTSLSDTDAPEKLYPLQALAQSVSLRFKFHFEGTRQTNRLDKPEWYFTHVLNVVNEHKTVMEGPIQRLLSSTKHKDVKAHHEFTVLLFPLLQRKLRKTIPSLLHHPPLLAHTIYQALSFDAALQQEGFDIADSSSGKAPGEDSIIGISETILGQKEWFEAWLKGEKKFADDQYNEIISTPDAWSLADIDSDQEGDQLESKVTNSARRLKSLVEQVTDRYSPLPSFNQRTRFLLSIQLPILEGYHARISNSLDAFESLSSAFVRAVPGALSVGFGGREEGGVALDTRRLTAGVEGIQRLSKALLSAQYLQKSLGEWGEEVFFLELWREMNKSPSLRAIAQDVPILPSPTPSPSDEPVGTIFEELMQRYGKLTKRAQDMIVQQITGEIEQNLKAHFATMNSLDPNAGPSDDIRVSQTLLGPIALLSSHLNFLRTTLSRTLVVLLYRTIGQRLSEHILQRQILYRGDVTPSEGKNILAECELWLEACQNSLGGVLGGGRNRVESPWLKLVEASRIVGSQGDTWSAIVSATNGGQDDSEWESNMLSFVGSNELSREEVARIIRRRKEA